MQRKVTIGVLNFNGAANIRKAIERLRAVRYEPIEEIIVLDNASTDQSLQILESEGGDLRVIANPVNEGAAGGRNRLLKAAVTDLVLLLDIDTFPEPDALTLMVNAYDADPERIAIVHARIVNEADPALIEYDGTCVHFLGTGSVKNRNSRVGEVPDHARIVTCTGGNTLVSKRNIAASGGYDEDFFYGYEDQDFTVRATLAGKLCVQVSQAIFRHGEGTPGLSMRPGVKYTSTRAFFYTRNRHYFILKNFAWPTLLAIFPALLLYEILQLAFMIKTGNFRSWARAIWQLSRNVGSALRKRRRVQKQRKVKDKDILCCEGMTSPLGLESSPVLRYASQCIGVTFAAYWSVARRLI